MINNFKDFDVLEKMYAAVFHGNAAALTLLDELNIGEAKKVLRDSLLKAEDIYVTAEERADEPDEPDEPDGQEDS